MKEIISENAERTYSLGFCLGELLQPGDTVVMRGDLGSGKTMFSGGVAAGLGVDPATPVTSPTYTILNSYQGKTPMHHFDLYRLSGAGEIVDLGFEELLSGPGVCLLEWGDRLGALMPETRLEIEFQYVDDQTRRIIFFPHGDHYRKIVERLDV